jgi:tetratricopeptide (TPR) repeat protein
MNTKILFPAIAAFLLAIMSVYFIANPSYRKSIEAKYYFEIGDYKEAYSLANEAFSIDVYNRMASTIMAQSKTSLKYVEYIETAKEYMKQINEIAKSKENISDAQKAKIRLMSQIMVESYVKLAPSIITDSDLVEEAARYYKNFEKLLEKVSQ